MFTNSVVKRRTDQPIASDYGPVGDEYYDVVKHPTCAAFGSASAQLLAQYMSWPKTTPRLKICDVGAGRSIVAALLGDQLESVGQLFLVDESPEMLAWSNGLHTKNIIRKIAAASTIDQFGVKFDMIVASLGDPYNTNEFWRSVANALTPRGVCLFTTPSFEWASTFRRVESEEADNLALFELRNGDKHFVPSIILSEENQHKMVRVAGLTVTRSDRLSLEDTLKRPPKLAHLDASVPVATLYCVQHISQMPT